MAKGDNLKERVERLEKAVFSSGSADEQAGVEKLALASTVPSGPEGDALRAAVDAADERDEAAEAAAEEAAEEEGKEEGKEEEAAA